MLLQEQLCRCECIYEIAFIKFTKIIGRKIPLDNRKYLSYLRGSVRACGISKIRWRCAYFPTTFKKSLLFSLGSFLSHADTLRTFEISKSILSRIFCK